MSILTRVFLIAVCVFAVAAMEAEDPPRYGDWGPPINLGPVVNSTYGDAGASISKDGLSLYFNSTRPGGKGLLDIYVSHRASVDQPWGPPVNLGPNINTAGNDQTSFISADEHSLYFGSDGRVGFGSMDIYVSRRHNKLDDSDWQIPVNLGSGVNTVDWEYAPVLFEDDKTGITTLFISRWPGSIGAYDIYASTLQADETFGLATVVEELCTIRGDQRVTIRKDGLELMLDSNRGGTENSTSHLWVYTRASTAEPWSSPYYLASVNSTNTADSDLRPTLSFDGTELYFQSNRAGSYGANDLYVCKRTEIIQPPQYSPWSAPVNLGKTVNSSDADSGAFISEDGLSLYFNSYNRPGGYGGFDIWVSQRASADDPWGAPQNLGPTINTSDNEQTPALSLDGHWLYFASDKSSGYGGLDLYVSRRPNKRDDFGWQAPENLGKLVNTAATESGPALFEDSRSGVTLLYFSSDQLVAGTEHIYASILQPDEVLTLPCMLQNPVSYRPWVTWGAAAFVPELNSLNRDVRPAIRKDGLEMYLDSDRPGTVGGQDIWASTRASTSDPWPLPKNLGSTVNSKVLEARPALSSDGTELYFHSNRPGGSGANDLYRCTRTRLKGEF
jgi:hypothetical protein